jgi:hypothetical protein
MIWGTGEAQRGRRQCITPGGVSARLSEFHVPLALGHVGPHDHDLNDDLRDRPVKPVGDASPGFE